MSLVLIAVGVFVGYLLPRHSASPSAETGTVTAIRPLANGAGTEFVFKPKGGTSHSYRFAVRTPWREQASGTWRTTGRPSCLAPRSSAPRTITLGVVSIQSVNAAPGGDVVVWLQCQR